jgi:CRM1 / Exportin repeat 2/CRM1 / Exportin repeat 3
MLKARHSAAPGGLKLDNTSYDANEVFKKIFTSDCFNGLFKIIVRKMPRPQEVLIETDENGVPRKVTVENTENANMFTMVQQTLANMARINWESMSMIIYNMINQQNHPENFSPDFINSLSWAVGALNGTLSETEEKSYLNLILRVNTY